MNKELSAPLHVDFSITGRCQLRCSYCSAMPLGDPDVSTERALAIIKELGELGVFSLILSGGEPTIHRDFQKLAAAAARTIPSLTINTNGLSLAKPEVAQSLRISAPNAVIAISLDSINAEENDASRGTGGEKAIRAIENCLDNEMNLCISSVLTEATSKSASKIIERFYPAVKQFRFFPRVPRNLDDSRLNGSSYRQSITSFYRDLREYSKSYPGVTIFTPMGDAAKISTSTKSISPEKSQCICTATRLYINSQLEVFPCYYSASQENLLGSCHTNSIEEIWNSEKMQLTRQKSNSSKLCGITDSIETIPNRYKNIKIQQVAK